MVLPCRCPQHPRTRRAAFDRRDERLRVLVPSQPLGRYIVQLRALRCTSGGPHALRNDTVENASSRGRVSLCYPFEELRQRLARYRDLDYEARYRLQLARFSVRADSGLVRDRCYDPADLAMAKGNADNRADLYLEIVRDQVVESLVYPPRRNQRYNRRNPAAGRQLQIRVSSSTLSVCSQVKSLSERPK